MDFCWYWRGGGGVGHHSPGLKSPYLTDSTWITADQNPRFQNSNWATSDCIFFSVNNPNFCSSYKWNEILPSGQLGQRERFRGCFPFLASYTRPGRGAANVANSQMLSFISPESSSGLPHSFPALSPGIRRENRHAWTHSSARPPGAGGGVRGGGTTTRVRVLKIDW